jgi:opacity protein-like surface antigen
MKRVILLVGTILLLCVAASAQEAASTQPSAVGVTGKGLKLGFDIASINTDYDELDEFLDSRAGFSGGAFLTYSLSRQFAIQPEILYVTKGAEKGVFIFNAYWSMDYLEIPVLMKCNLAPDGRVRPTLFAGPALSYLLGSKIGAINESIDVADGMKTLDIGLVFGGGLDYKRVTFDVRYTMGLMNTVDADKVNEATGAEVDDFYYLEGDPSVKNTNISFMFGVLF